MYAHKTTQQYTTEKISPFLKWAKNTTEKNSYFMHTHAEQFHAVYCRPGRAHEPTMPASPRTFLHHAHTRHTCTSCAYQYFRASLVFLQIRIPGKISMRIRIRLIENVKDLLEIQDYALFCLFSTRLCHILLSVSISVMICLKKSLGFRLSEQTCCCCNIF
jgi:hypothetical protein